MNVAFDAKSIAAAAGSYPNAIHRQAAREQWPKRPQGSRIFYIPPPALAAKCQAPPRDPEQTYRELLRAAAVCGFHRLLRTHPHWGTAACYQKCAREFKRLMPHISERSLRSWVAVVAKNGLAALQEARKGRCGTNRKATA